MYWQTYSSVDCTEVAVSFQVLHLLLEMNRHDKHKSLKKKKIAVGFMHGTIAKVGVLNCAALVVLSLKVILKYCHFDIYFFMPSVSSNL